MLLAVLALSASFLERQDASRQTRLVVECTEARSELRGSSSMPVHAEALPELGQPVARTWPGRGQEQPIIQPARHVPQNRFLISIKAF